MKRYELIERLVKLGLSKNTLVDFNDKQLIQLSNRMLGEQKGSVVMSKAKTPPSEIKRVTDTGLNVELREKLVGKQKNLDKNKNGKLDSQDFKMLRNETKKPSAGLSKSKKSAVVKAAKAGKDIGKKGKGFKEVEKKAKESGAKNPKAVAAAAMWKNIKRENVEVKDWATQLLEKHYHPATTKKEIMETITRKLRESSAAPAPSKPKTTPTVKPGTKPGTKPGIKPLKPFKPGKSPNPAPKMSSVQGTMFSFDALKSVAEENAAPAPSKPKTTPTVKPGTKPGTKPGIKPLKPFKPGKSPNPGTKM